MRRFFFIALLLCAPFWVFGQSIDLDNGGSGVASPGNSSDVPLGIGEVYTGTPLDLTAYSIVFVSVYADVASAADGLSIQQSVDGVNWDFSDDYTIGAGVSENYSINPHAHFLRIVYINGPVAQTAFRLQTIAKTRNAKASSHRVKDNIDGDDDAELVKAAITGVNGDDRWHNVMVTQDGNLAVVNNSSGLAIAQGKITGVANVNKFGNVPDFDFGDNEVYVWDGANDGGVNAMVYTFSNTANIDSLSSTNAADNQQIEIQGLDAAYNLTVDTVTLNGQNVVTIPTPFIRVFRMRNVGTTDVAGKVYMYTGGAVVGGLPSVSANVRAVIDNGSNQTEMAIYTTPANKTAYIREIYASAAGASKVTNYVVKLYVREFGSVFQLKHRRAINDDKDLEKVFDTPERAPAKSDIVVTVQATESGVTSASVSAGFDIVLIDN